MKKWGFLSTLGEKNIDFWSFEMQARIEKQKTSGIK